jgi:hypothetical protein
MVTAVIATSYAALPATGSVAASGCAKVHSDFNGDGHADVATRALNFQGDEVGVYYTASGKLPTKNIQVFGHITLQPMMPPGYDLGDGDQIGAAIVAGNFNNDCYSDLAIGVPAVESPDPVDANGIVIILYGSPTGLSIKGGTVLLDTDLNPAASATPPDDLGATLAAGNFNGDGYTDLAIGAPQSDLTTPGAGAVAVVFGSATGLQLAGHQWWTQDSPGVPGANEVGDSLRRQPRGR